MSEMFGVLIKLSPSCLYIVPAYINLPSRTAGGAVRVRLTPAIPHMHSEPVVSMTQHVSAEIRRAPREGIGDEGEKNDTAKECEAVRKEGQREQD